MEQEVDIAALEWGVPPVPLLPQTLRAVWAVEKLPSWVARDLSLPDGATAAQLTGDFACIAGAGDRIRHFVRAYVAQRMDAVRGVRCFAHAAPAGFQLSMVPLGTRSLTAIERSGIAANPAKLFDSTYGDLLRISGLGVATLLEIVALTECAATRFCDTVEACHAKPDASAARHPVAPATLPSTWRADCERVLAKEWADKISSEDPRFAEIMPVGPGTVEERLLAVLGDPIEAALKASALVKTLPAIEERVALIESLTLEESLVDYLAAAWGYQQERVNLLGMRLGWLGEPPRTLQQCGGHFGITRERVRQLEKKMRDAMPKHPVFLPRLDDALEIVEAAAPLDTPAAETLLIQKGICKRAFSIDSLFAAASDFGRQTTASLTEFSGQRCVSTTSQDAVVGAVVRKAKAIASANGVASVYQLVDDCPAEAGTYTNHTPPHPDETLIRQALRAWPACKFVNEDWFSFYDLPPGRNRVLNTLDRMLAVSPRLQIADVREGVRRVMKYRNSAHGSAVELVTPPAPVLEAYLQSHPDYRVHDGCVEAKVPRTVDEQLAEAERVMYEVFEEAGGGVLDRRSFIEGCIRKGINENTASTYTTYSPIIEHLGKDLWKLRGRSVDATLVEAVRQSNQERSRERRCIHFGWTSRGTLSVAWVLPWQTSSLALGIPGAISRYLCGRSFDARNSVTGKPCGKVVVTEEGTSYGYSPFLRHVAAEAGDVLVANFDSSSSEVGLEMSDINTIGDGEEFADE
jgi:hypothetical protein